MKYLASAPSRAALAGVGLALLVIASGCSSSGADFATTGGGGAGTSGSAGVGGGLGGTGGGAQAALRATGVAVGASHSCALLQDGTVACWGDGALGQLGDGSAGMDHVSVVPVVVPGLAGVTAIRAGGDTTCAITAHGASCWGDGTFGQLGDGMSGDGYYAAKPVAVKGLDAVVDLSVSGSNACAALQDGTVRCWGRNAKEDWLGFASADCGPFSMKIGTDPPTLVSVPCEAAPRKVPGATGAVAVAAGGEHNCALASLGGASCWGADNFGQLGDGVSGPDAHDATPAQVLGDGKMRSLSLGASHSCAIVGDAMAVRCWGDNSFGQLGVGVNEIDSYKTTPTLVPGLAGAIDLDAAAQTTCAALGDGTVSCWGDTSTVLPVSPKGGALVPTPLPGLTSARAVRTSGAHACAVLADASVVCWGQGDRGQLGDGGMSLADFSLSPVPAPLAHGGPG